MSFKFYFIGMMLTFILPNLVLSQTIDSTKIKYDAFVTDKKAKAKDKYTYSQFSIALRYKDTLNLNAAQIDQMYSEIKNLKSLKNAHYTAHKESLDTRSLESQKMVQVLTGTQYDLLLRLKNHSKSKANAENDWKEMEIRNMNTQFSKGATVAELYEYYVIRESLYDKYRHDPISQSAETKAHYNNRPACMKALTKLRRTNTDTFGNNLNGN